MGNPVWSTPKPRFSSFFFASPGPFLFVAPVPFLRARYRVRVHGLDFTQRLSLLTTSLLSWLAGGTPTHPVTLTLHIHELTFLPECNCRNCRRLLACPCGLLTTGRRLAVSPCGRGWQRGHGKLAPGEGLPPSSMDSLVLVLTTVPRVAASGGRSQQ